MSFSSLADFAPAPGERPRSTRRTGEPVRRQSFAAHRLPPGYRTKITRREARELVLAATMYDRTAREKGKRPLGRAALQILEFLANLAAYSGRVEPSYEYIMEKVGCARDTITRALKALRAHGFLDWVRRYVPTGNAEGPQVQQTSNAYRLALPAIAKRLLARFTNPAPIPADVEQEAHERAQQVEAMRATLTKREQLALEFGGGEGREADERRALGESLARLWDSIQKRESDKQGESRV
ncbi:helix-turn-helix domain-containing protein [Microvirga sesbaniae]|uniref:helix-turn-helix domain-containing protein n=1 Tax=Microvirga sesbaniae TaxID=681392 RepID=UPI0021C5B08C|nr:helix-turn-helix domain-containing protein [Microvirga sp. HBU67692]